MKWASSLLIVLIVMLVAAVSFADDTPDWAKREFAGPADQVFAAALRSIQAQKHEVKSKDDASHSVEFHVGTTAWSWGYNMRLTVTAIDASHSKAEVTVGRSGGKTFSWGSGKKEINKIFAGIDAELAASHSGLK